jgi:hypothetical protein
MNEPNESKIANLLASLDNLSSGNVVDKVKVLAKCIAELDQQNMKSDRMYPALLKLFSEAIGKLQKQVEALQKKLDDHEGGLVIRKQK